MLTGKNISLVGYTGNATIDGYPTDDWIAGAVCATESRQWCVPVNHNHLQRYSVGEVIRSLRTCVDEYRRRESPAQLRNFYLEILIVGYRAERQLRGSYIFRLVWVGPKAHASGHDRPVVPSLGLGALYASPRLDPSLHAEFVREMARPARGPKDFFGTWPQSQLPSPNNGTAWGTASWASASMPRHSEPS